MTGELEYVIFNTEMGWVGILASGKGLLATTLPQPSAQEAHQQLGDRVKQARRSPHLSNDLMERLTSYFSGHRVTLADELDLPGATLFQREVWQATKLIPYGETRSYLWVAEQIKHPKAARAVGQALGSNPLAIIVPCHRVLASDGRLGGFGGGVEMKQDLLQMEAGASSG